MSSITVRTAPGLAPNTSSGDGHLQRDIQPDRHCQQKGRRRQIFRPELAYSDSRESFN